MEAGRNRLRPILMTTISTILAMAPIGFFPGAGADTIQPIGRTFVGGLSVSSIMTLFVTPVLYSLLNRDTALSKNKLPRPDSEETQPS
jgi:HAE1 family hydrophobic/amphiphilic exporter-1